MGCVIVGAAALAVATTASASLPKKPACSQVSYSTIASAFKFTPVGTKIAKTATTLSCTYYFFLFEPPGVPLRCPEPGSCVDGKPIGSISVAFRSSVSAAQYEKNREASKAALGSIRRVSGIGDAAFIGTNLNSTGGALVFHDGTYLVTIRGLDHYDGGGGPGPGAAFTRAIERFAKAIIPQT